MTDEMKQALLDAVKSELDIYWNDDDVRLTRYVGSSYQWLIAFNDGADVVFEETSLEFDLITQRSRYQYHNAVDLFEKNYAELINKITLKYALEKRFPHATT